MPSLKDLTCTIELSHAHQPLPEYNTLYGDGIVETCVPIPTQPQSFSIHLTSTKFIAPGIALFVYIDGVYQCNRNRQGLKPGKPSDRRSLVDFRVRQKEERKRDGSMVAKEWTFDTSSTDESCARNTLENKDCIEVVVLRCSGTRDAKAVPPMNLDGTGDWSDGYLDSDAGSSKEHKWSGYNDRGPEFDRVGSGFESRPPPPLSYRAPYAESLRSGKESDYKIHYERERSSRASTSRRPRHGSRYSGTISPHTRRANDLPPEGFQYGSGPIPSEKGSHRRKHSNTGLETNGVDPAWLNKLLKTAVKQGVEESRRAEVRSEKHDRDSTHASQKEDLTSQAPGAWPESPIPEHKEKSSKSKRVSSHKSDYRSDGGSDWGQSQDAWTQHETKSKAETHVNWEMEPAWETETSSGGNGWHSNDEMHSESWDTDETWETARGEEWKNLSTSTKLCPSTAPPQFDPQLLVRPGPSKPVHGHSEDRRWVNHAPYSSSVSLSSSNDTVQPSHFQDRVQAPRRKYKASRHPSKSLHSHHTRNSSHHTQHKSSWHHPAEASKPSVPSSITHVIPVIVNAPATPVPKHPRSKKSSTHADTRVSPLPVPAWVAAVQDTMKTQRSSTPPALYAEAWGEKGKERPPAWDETRRDKASACGEAGKDSTTTSEKKLRSTSSSTWGSTRNSNWDTSKDSTWDAATTWSLTPKPSHKTDWTTEPSSPPPVPWTATPSRKKPQSKKDRKANYVAKSPVETPIAPKSSPPQPKRAPDTSKNVPVPPFTTNWSFAPSSPPPAAQPPSPRSHASTGKTTVKKSLQPTAIRTTAATDYGHAVARPEYLDSLERPYAVFRFRCRRGEREVVV